MTYGQRVAMLLTQNADARAAARSTIHQEQYSGGWLVVTGGYQRGVVHWVPTRHHAEDTVKHHYNSVLMQRLTALRRMYAQVPA